ncbi:MAG: hypothetical protein EOP41_02890 [Sphingobacteriaceae bacterium]|nr:MAG: hypothetical protein EOP41_02890 [Sphingobacteriaceae bacterium]
MTYQRKYFFLSLFFLICTITSCKKWEDHDAITDAQLSKNLLDQISQNPSLSTFNGYLVKSGYDKIISSSKTYTVWAPDNTAMQSVDQAILNDTTRLKLFVGNHIANQSYATTEPQGSMRIKILNGKNATFTRTNFEEANIIQANQYVGNGILHYLNRCCL